ncbi:MAG: DUF366 family protein [Bdellovibrionaceae bacterium]|nr:DUF366 family protein [Pseudobdellovibrionaceae bacterium]
MKSLFIEKSISYDGTQLRSLFAYMDYGLQGDSIVSWIGPCNVSFDHMVDGEDLLAKAEIRGGQMVHFIVECFSTPLAEMVWQQRLLASLVHDFILEKGRVEGRVPAVRRDGDDVFVKLPDREGKFSISIATVSPVSGLLHFAVNVSNSGTPVPTASLEDLGLLAAEFAMEIIKRFVSEFESVRGATTKVRWVR